MRRNELRIEDVCDFIGGSQPPKAGFLSEPHAGYVRLIQIRDYKTDAFPTYIRADSTRKFCDAKDIMIGRYGPPIFQICRGLAGAYNVALLKAKPKKCIDREYLYYFLKQDTVFQYVDKLSARTGGQTGVDLVSLNKYPIHLPENIEDQRRLVSVLSAIDAKIDCNNRINAELEAMARTLYDYWFVQFDFPDANGMPYKSDGGKMVYNAMAKREIPVGWHASTIGDTFSTHLGGTPSRERRDYWAPGDINWLSSGENPSTFVVAPDERISSLGLRNSPARLLPQGTVILSIVRHLRASILAIDAATNQSVVGVLETEKLKHCFIYPYLLREIPRLMVIRTGAQQPHINKGVLDESLVIIPDDATLEAYTSHAAPLFLQIRNHLLQNLELSQLRDWLLPMLMNGQVTVA